MDEDEDIEEKDGFGLDKDRRLTERRERKEEEDGPEPLDPAFPYRVISINPLLFGRLASRPSASGSGR
jgi:hypothetical protein